MRDIANESVPIVRKMLGVVGKDEVYVQISKARECCGAAITKDTIYTWVFVVTSKSCNFVDDTFQPHSYHFLIPILIACP